MPDGNPNGSGWTRPLKRLQERRHVMVTAHSGRAALDKEISWGLQVVRFASAKSLMGGRGLFRRRYKGRVESHASLRASARGPFIWTTDIPTTAEFITAAAWKKISSTSFRRTTDHSVLKRKPSDRMAQEIAEVITAVEHSEPAKYLAQPSNSVNVESSVPTIPRRPPVPFVPTGVGLTMPEPPTDARVVINHSGPCSGGVGFPTSESWFRCGHAQEHRDSDRRQLAAAACPLVLKEPKPTKLKALVE